MNLYLTARGQEYLKYLEDRFSDPPGARQTRLTKRDANDLRALSRVDSQIPFEDSAQLFTYYRYLYPRRLVEELDRDELYTQELPSGTPDEMEPPYYY